MLVVPLIPSLIRPMVKKMSTYLKEVQKIQAKSFGKVKMWIHTYDDEDGGWFSVTNMNNERNQRNVDFYSFRSQDWDKNIEIIKGWLNDKDNDNVSELLSSVDIVETNNETKKSNKDFVMGLQKGDYFHTEFEYGGKPAECFCEFEQVNDTVETYNISWQQIKCSRLITIKGIEPADGEFLVGIDGNTKVRKMTDEEIIKFNEAYDRNV